MSQMVTKNSVHRITFQQLLWSTATVIAAYYLMTLCKLFIKQYNLALTKGWRSAAGVIMADLVLASWWQPNARLRLNTNSAAAITPSLDNGISSGPYTPVWRTGLTSFNWRETFRIYNCLVPYRVVVYKLFIPPSEKSRLRSFFGLVSGMLSTQV